MLKLLLLFLLVTVSVQPPSGGCVLKPFSQLLAGCFSSSRLQAAVCLNKSSHIFKAPMTNQPPSGGCVLKHSYVGRGVVLDDPAAFRRLCVET